MTSVFSNKTNNKFYDIKNNKIIKNKKITIRNGNINKIMIQKTITIDNKIKTHNKIPSQ